MGTHQEPRWRGPMEAQEWSRGRHHTGRARSVKKARPDHVHDGPVADYGPELRKDFEALPRQPARVRRCLRQGMVQADASRHGTYRALSWPTGSQGITALAGSHS